MKHNVCLYDGSVKWQVTFRGYTTVANFVNVYFPLKIIILAKREREVTTKFAIACNRCYRAFFLSFVIVIPIAFVIFVKIFFAVYINLNVGSFEIIELVKWLYKVIVFVCPR